LQHNHVEWQRASLGPGCSSFWQSRCGKPEHTLVGGNSNLILWVGNAVNGAYGIVGGTGNVQAQTAPFSSVLSGTGNAVAGPASVILTGNNNIAKSGLTVVVTGVNNTASGTSSVVVNGENNYAMALGSNVYCRSCPRRCCEFCHWQRKR